MSERIHLDRYTYLKNRIDKIIDILLKIHIITDDNDISPLEELRKLKKEV